MMLSSANLILIQVFDYQALNNGNQTPKKKLTYGNTWSYLLKRGYKVCLSLAALSRFYCEIVFIWHTDLEKEERWYHAICVGNRIYTNMRFIVTKDSTWQWLICQKKIIQPSELVIYVALISIFIRPSWRKFASTIVSFSNCLRSIIQRNNLTSIIFLFSLVGLSFLKQTRAQNSFLVTQVIIRELTQPRRRRQQKPHKFASLTTENSILARFG